MLTVPLVVRTGSGSVLGARTPFGVRFRNVPYAAPPFGARRLLPAQPPVPWHGLRDGSKPGLAMPQRSAPTMAGILGAYAAPGPQGEDALTLEIDTPELGGARLPVLVWLPSGVFVSGGASAPSNAGGAFARDGIVHVAINHRLGVDGFCLFPDSIDTGTDNLGLRDVVAALSWVRENIAAFGGDPDRVTIGGYGSGATLAAAVAASPLSAGLVHGALLQSGIPRLSLRRRDAEAVLAIMERAVGVRLNREVVREASVPFALDLTDAVIAEMAHDDDRWSWFSLAGSPFCAVTETPSLPARAIEAFGDGVASGVPILAGTTTDQLGYVVEARLRALGRLDAVDAVFDDLGIDRATIEWYRSNRCREMSGLAIATAVLTDMAARVPTIRLLDAHRGEHFLYEFRWNSPVLEPGLSGAGGLDIPFARDDFEVLDGYPDAAALYPSDPPRSLVDAMHGSFVEFVRTGDPGWDAYVPNTRSTMWFDEVSVVVPDLASEERRLWHGPLAVEV